MDTNQPITHRLVAEGLGTALLLATVVGSGIMGAKLASGNVAIALLANSLATGAALVVLIWVFGPISGAHFNPVVTATMGLREGWRLNDVALYILSQVVGAVVGVWLAHVMFDLATFQVSTTVRTGFAQWVAEAVATFGLLVTILGCISRNPSVTPIAVGLYITSAYWFTASTSFANPAVTIARALSETFAGIAPSSVPGFIAAQAAGAVLAVFVCQALWPKDRHRRASSPS